jgi:hypothetical protein
MVGGCSIWHSDTYDYWLNGPSLHETFLGRKIIRYFRSLLWKWEQLVGDGAHTPSKQGMDGSTRRIFDSGFFDSGWVRPLISQLTSFCVANLLCC